MEQANLKYYCYACQKYFHSATEVFSCLKCDSCAIELAGHSKQEKNNEEELSNFQVYEVKNETTQPQQVLGTLQNNVRPRQRSLRTMLGSSIQIIQGPQIRLNYDFSQNSYLFNLMRQLFGEGHIPQRATQQQINKLEKIQHVKQCSICQSVQQGQEQKEKEVKASEVSQGFKLKCNHTFHESCIKPWFERANTCPVCRTKLD